MDDLDSLDDLISRQEVIDIILDNVRLIPGHYAEYDEVVNKDDVIERIKRLPAINHEKRTEMGLEITIEIPKEFKNHFLSDGFQDSFNRMIYELRDMLKKDELSLTWNYDIEVLEMLRDAFQKCTL